MTVFYGVERDGGVPLRRHPKRDGDVTDGRRPGFKPVPADVRPHDARLLGSSEVFLRPPKPLRGRKVWLYPAAVGWPKTRGGVFSSSPLLVPSRKPALHPAWLRDSGLKTPFFVGVFFSCISSLV